MGFESRTWVRCFVTEEMTLLTGKLLDLNNSSCMIAIGIVPIHVPVLAPVIAVAFSIAITIITPITLANTLCYYTLILSL